MNSLLFDGINTTGICQLNTRQNDEKRTFELDICVFALRTYFFPL